MDEKQDERRADERQDNADKIIEALKKLEEDSKKHD
jgi:hypothetical protein